MWRNYWTVAVRALAKSRTYSVINIAGLAIGMAACIMILLYINYERSYDSWLPDAENTYQLQTWSPHPSDGEPFFSQMAPIITKERVKKDFPQVASAVYALSTAPVFIKDGQASPTKDYVIADDDFTKVVSLPMVAGTGPTADRTVIVSESEAMRRFGTVQVVGRTMTTISKGVARDFTITGVFKDIPKNSSMKLNAVQRLDMTSFMAQEPQFLTCWGCQSGWV
jgi:putative ABC transport system permease protein